jgi:hypothetical protein
LIGYSNSTVHIDSQLIVLKWKYASERHTCKEKFVRKLVYQKWVLTGLQQRLPKNKCNLLTSEPKLFWLQSNIFVKIWKYFTQNYSWRLISWAIVLEMLVDAQLLKKVHAYYSSKRFIATFTSLPLVPNPGLDDSTPSFIICGPIIMLSNFQSKCVLQSLSFLVFLIQDLYVFLISPMHTTSTVPFNLLGFTWLVKSCRALHYPKWTKSLLCEIWGLHSGSVEDSGFLACDAVVLG